MPRGVPRIGSGHTSDVEPIPANQTLGTISTNVTHPAPSTASWSSEGGVSIDLSEPPPPWENDPQYGRHDTDARRFVKVPDNWELRWVNPRMIDRAGWREWQPVMASDPRITVLVKPLVSPENNIRRGGQGGDILCWMYKSWVESRLKVKAKKVAALQGKSVRQQEEAVENLRRSGAHRFMKVDAMHHPTQTIGDGRTMQD